LAMHFCDMEDDILQHIGDLVKNIQFIGPLSIVACSRVSWRLYTLFVSKCARTRLQWERGFLAKYTWKVEQFNTRSNKMYSPVFTSGHGHHWRMLLFPKGNRIVARGPSLYLEVVNAPFLPCGWFRQAAFKMIVHHNANEKCNLVTNSTDICFCDKHQDWGYRMVVSQFTPEQFKCEYMCQDQSVTFSVEIHIQPYVANMNAIFESLRLANEVKHRDWQDGTLVKYMRHMVRNTELMCTMCDLKLSNMCGDYFHCNSMHTHDMTLMARLLSDLLQPDVAHFSDHAVFRNDVDQISAAQQLETTCSLLRWEN